MFMQMSGKQVCIKVIYILNLIEVFMSYLLSSLIAQSTVIDEKIEFINERPFEHFSRITTKQENKCIFFAEKKYAEYLDSSVSMIITNKEIYSECSQIFSNYGICISENPKGLYFELLNEYEKKHKKAEFDTIIGKNCTICQTAIISKKNVKIGNNVFIDDFVKIYPNVTIGDNVTIQAGSIVGIQDFDMYNYNGVSKQVYHNGEVLVGDNVFIGSHCVIGQALYDYGKTIINKNAKINHGSLIGHNDDIGENTKISKGAVIAGWVTTGKDCFFGVGAMVRNAITIGNNVTVGMGSVVTKDISPNLTVIGNPAHPK